MELLDLPHELINEIVYLAVNVHPRPADILCVNHLFHSLAEQFLYGRLILVSANQLQKLSETLASPRCTPKTIALNFAGRIPQAQTFTWLASLLRRLVGTVPGFRGLPPLVGGNEPSSDPLHRAASQLSLNTLFFCMHSLQRAEYLTIFYALSYANPRTFVWTGPDPEHHFSASIVPNAAYGVTLAMASWSNLVHLKLTNISFTGTLFPFRDTDGNALYRPLFPSLARLKTVYLGQVVFLPPAAIAATIALPMPSLVEMRLVDVYHESIWGPRMRRSDVEHAVVAAAETTGGISVSLSHLLDRIRNLVRCEAKSERIVGGDRGEGTGSLD